VKARLACVDVCFDQHLSEDSKATEQLVQQIFEALLAYSPRVEPSEQWPGVFWIDATGLNRVFGSLEQWASDVHQHMESLAFVSSIAVGYARFSTFAIARSSVSKKYQIMKSQRQESHQAKLVPLSLLSLSGKLLQDMAVLGVHTLGDFTEIPAHALRIRYGEEAEMLHRLATGKKWTPLEPRELKKAIQTELEVDPPDDNTSRLLFGLKTKFHSIIDQLIERCEGITALALTLHLDHAGTQQERNETAAPTLDVLQITDLVRLRLSVLQLQAPVERITVVTESTPVHPKQLNLLQGKNRDLEAVARAFATIKAMFGSQSVVQAALCDAILPEAKYRWEPLQKLTYPQPYLFLDAPEKMRPMMRQALRPPIALPDIPQHEPEHWLGMYGAVKQMRGPYRINGGWWQHRVGRDYYFIETQRNELLWSYYDVPRRRWMLHGLVD